MSGLIQAMVLGVARNLAAAGGTWLLSHGIVNADGAQSFVGSVCFLAALGFTAYDKLVVHGKIQAASGS